MSTDYFTIGCTPGDEPCIQVGHPKYSEIARTECSYYIQDLTHNLRNRFSLTDTQDLSVVFRIKSFPHDFGSYHEVAVYYDPSDQISVDQAIVAEEGLEHWSEESAIRLQALYNLHKLDLVVDRYRDVPGFNHS
jgi:hypothetical protein